MAINTARPLAEVFQDIVGNVQEIIRSELRLAKAELKQEAGTAAKASVALLAGLVFGIYAIGFLLLALVYGLAQLIGSWWIGALIVGGALLLLTRVMLGVGRARLRAINPAPERTIRSAKESLAWDKHPKT